MSLDSDLKAMHEGAKAHMFTDAELYHLFLAVDDRCRGLRAENRPPELLALRERLLPFYVARHPD